jgi:transposase
MPPIAAGLVFTSCDRRRLKAAMGRVRDARHYRRLAAVWLVAKGHSVGATANLLNASRRWVTKALARYRARRRPEELAEGKRSGRPPVAPGLSRQRLTELLQTDPMSLGYAAVGWTAPLLSAHVRRCDAADALCVRTMRGRLHAAGLAWKRPRYVFSQKEPHRAQKKGPSRAD